jgi:hypothetical protein
LELKFPCALLANCDAESGVTLTLASGEDIVLEVKTRGERINTDSPWRSKTIFLDEDPLALAGFIRALICRYNALVERMNSQTQDTKMRVLAPIEPDDQIGRGPDNSLR